VTKWTLVKTEATVVVRFDDSWSIAFEIERVDDDRVAIFLPGAPDPWSGSMCVVTADRVALLQKSCKERAGIQSDPTATFGG
jgi:uncharacterized membrane protein